MSWARHRYGPEFAAWLVDDYEPIDPVVRLAEEDGVVLLHGGGFDGPAWSVRVSLANLDDDCYVEVGAAVEPDLRRIRRALAGDRRLSGRHSCRLSGSTVRDEHAGRTGGDTRCDEPPGKQEQTHERDP